ncbi:MAG: hypothetical protein JST73_13170 [Actinobacteria bacterium]|nr:hypothetical protein [Actinomycetota bacterium]
MLVFALGGAIGAFVVASRHASTVPRLTSAQASEALLPASAVPGDGWSVTTSNDSSDVTYTPKQCNDVAQRTFGDGASAHDDSDSVDFGPSDASGDWDASMAVVPVDSPGEAKAMVARFRDIADGPCRTFEIPADHASGGTMSVIGGPTVGDESVRIGSSIQVEGFTLQSQMVVVALGSNVVAVGQSGVGGPPLSHDDFNLFISRAIASTKAAAKG